MQFSIIQLLAVLAVTGTSLASPVSRNEDSNLDKRITITPEGVEISPEDIVQALDLVVEGIKSLDKFVHQHDAENAFTQSTVDRLSSEHNDKNVLIYHQQDSVTNFVNGVHTHYELDIGLGASQGYEIWLLDSGSFDHHGDGGYINWCFTGNYNREGSHVDFYPIGSAPPSKTRRATNTSSIIYDFNALPGSNKTHIPLHSPVVYTPPPPAATAHIPPATPTSIKNIDDGNYFLQCHNKNGSSALGLGYYKALVPHGGNKGQQPDDFTLLAETGPHSLGNGTASTHDAWRFPVGAMQFDTTGTTVHWSLFGNADGTFVSQNDTAGTANNGQEQFWMFKDDGEQLFTKDQWTCYSLYYAF